MKGHYDGNKTRIILGHGSSSWKDGWRGLWGPFGNGYQMTDGYGNVVSPEAPGMGYAPYGYGYGSARAPGVVCCIIL